MFSHIKRKSHLYLLIFILVVAFFFRSYKSVEWLTFDQDGELRSWIVRDIVVNKHLRLIGQLTSAPGVFIGSLLYYLNIPFFLLFNMDPAASIIPILIIGMLTIYSYYWVFEKLYNKRVGLIASFIYATSLYTISFDRWVVPSTPTNLWGIWYFFTLMMLLRKNFSVLPLLGILIGLIWHIHIALAPTLIAVPLAIFFSGKFPKLKQIAVFILIVFITSLPLIGFETRHNFSQTRSFFGNFVDNFGGPNKVETKYQLNLSKNAGNGIEEVEEQNNNILIKSKKEIEIGQEAIFKISSMLSKYNTIVMETPCGTRKKFEIGGTEALFNWDTTGCNEGNKNILIYARESIEPFWKRDAGKFYIIFQKEVMNMYQTFVYPWELSQNGKTIFTIIVFLTPLFALSIKKLKKSEVIVLYSIVFGVFAFFSLSSVPISEYYLAILEIVVFASIALIIESFYVFNKYIKYLIIIFLSIILIRNFFSFINQSPYRSGYVEKKEIVSMIKKEMILKNYPCVGINYIAKAGNNVGFRYLLWLNKIKVAKAQTNLPIFNIVIPDEFAKDQIDFKSGHIGLILPKEEIDKNQLELNCSGEDTNITDSILGYTQ